MIGSRIQAVRPDFRIVICSATIDADHFRDYFNYSTSTRRDEPRTTIISLEGRMFPVEVAYAHEPVEDYVTAAVSTAMEIHLAVSLL